MFLKEFTEDKPWAHLDIAGVAWRESERDELTKGGTGFGGHTHPFVVTTDPVMS